MLHHCVGGSMAALGVHRGMSRKVSDWLVLPLYPKFHTGEFGIHTLGVREWEARFGRQADLLEALGEQMGVDLFEMAGVKRDLPRQ